jgi:hypothetical protein
MIIDTLMPLIGGVGCCSRCFVWGDLGRLVTARHWLRDKDDARVMAR